MHVLNPFRKLPTFNHFAKQFPEFKTMYVVFAHRNVVRPEAGCVLRLDAAGGKGHNPFENEDFTR